MKTASPDVQAGDLRASVARFLAQYPGDTICLRQIWYEGLDGHGVPGPARMDEMRAAIEGCDDWKPLGNVRHEKYGVQFTFRRAKPRPAGGGSAVAGGKSGTTAPNDLLIQHVFKLNSLHRAPDGRTFKIVVAEVYNLRCFEVVDGKLVGGMVKIHPGCELAQSLVEVTG
jgi:hypothetical protein